MYWLNYRDHPLICATSMCLGIALCISAWSAFWATIDVAGFIRISNWGLNAPAKIAARPWGDLVAAPVASTLAEVVAIAFGLCINALILGFAFGTAMRYSKYGVLAFRWTLKGFCALTIVPIFFILIFFNIHLLNTAFPTLLKFLSNAHWDKNPIVLFLVACPIPLLIGFLYYRLFEFFDRRLREDDHVL